MRKSILSVITSTIVLILLPFYSMSPISAAPFGNYIIFNGGTVNREIINPVSPAQFEVEVWIKPSDVSGVRQLLTIADNNQTNYRISINGGSLSLFYRFAANSSRNVVTGNLVENTWQKVRVSITETNTQMFINDSQISNVSGAAGLKPAGNKIILGTDYQGEMDQFRLSINGTAYIVWNFDQPRGDTNAVDSSGNNLHGNLTGGDYKIHYFGTLPTPTKFALPTLPSLRRITPKIVFPTNSQPTPTAGMPQPTSGSGSNTNWDRSTRPQLAR